MTAAHDETTPKLRRVHACGQCWPSNVPAVPLPLAHGVHGTLARYAGGLGAAVPRRDAEGAGVGAVPRLAAEVAGLEAHAPGG